MVLDRFVRFGRISFEIDFYWDKIRFNRLLAKIKNEILIWLLAIHLGLMEYRFQSEMVMDLPIEEKKRKNNQIRWVGITVSDTLRWNWPSELVKNWMNLR